MKRTTAVRLIPGPTIVPADVLAHHAVDYGSSDREESFMTLYHATQRQLAELMGIRADSDTAANSVVIESGEGMAALWGAMKSSISPGDRVLSLSTGVFGSGIADIARSVGADVKVVEVSPNDTLRDWASIEEAVAKYEPKMITAVHCETPSGTLNPIAQVGEIKRKHRVPLLYVDAVASIGGAEVRADEWGVDLLLGGSQKCLSCPPSLCFVGVSPAAWDAIEAVGYRGYDALLPWRRVGVFPGDMPYTHNWHGIAALHRACERIIDEEGLDRCIARHARVAQHCRSRMAEIGMRRFYAEGAVPSPTVTAVPVPDGMTWKALDGALRERGVIVGGSYGDLEGKVFRIGHMGAQAHEHLVDAAVDALRDAVSHS